MESLLIVLSWTISICAIVLFYFVGYRHGRLDIKALASKGKRLL